MRLATTCQTVPRFITQRTDYAVIFRRSGRLASPRWDRPEQP
jgi:hypothetical protein